MMTYQSENTEDEFLLGRILFLMTYNTNLDYEKLVNENGLADTINSVWLLETPRSSVRLIRSCSIFRGT
jgi:hypothetical protein